MLVPVLVGCATAGPAERTPAPGAPAVAAAAPGPAGGDKPLAETPPADRPPRASPGATDSSPEPDIARLREAVRLDPEDGDARYRLALALLGAERQETGEAAGATAAPARAETYLALARILLSRGEMAEAASWLREALRLQPDLGEARAQLGLALYAMGDLDGALDELRRVERASPDALRARLTLAALLVARQDWPAARGELEAIVQIEPGLAQAHYTLGVVRYALGDQRGAIEEYRRVLEIDPLQQDARYNMALILRLTDRDAEAAPAFLEAARAGHPRAQYFIGVAYSAGLGVERNLGVAVTWWFAAAGQGVPEAEEALAQLRQTALGKTRRPPADREAAEQAFADYRAGLPRQFPGRAREGDEPLGAALLRAGRVDEGVAILIQEASALSDPAEQFLEVAYEAGVGGALAPYDARILGYFKTAAAEGQPRPRIALARIYARGLGVDRDVARAVSLLKATPDENAQRLLRELSASAP